MLGCVDRVSGYLVFSSDVWRWSEARPYRWMARRHVGEYTTS